MWRSKTAQRRLRRLLFCVARAARQGGAAVTVCYTKLGHAHIFLHYLFLKYYLIIYIDTIIQAKVFCIRALWGIIQTD